MDGERDGRRGALLLAAGESARFGRTPKALARIDGEPAIVRMARVSNEAGFSPIAAVVGAHELLVRPLLEENGVEVVSHPGWADGRTGSVQAGLGRMGTGADLLIWPVDHPFVRESTLKTLTERARSDAMALWVLPTFQERGGHPVLVRPGALRMIASLGPDEPLRVLLPRLGPQVLRVPVPDPGVVANVDTQQAFALRLSEWRSREG
ncbi:MAG: nucleotidyltransferase family protein [Thermoplasmata archaeon]|nr:nucleotidyltransferase family protein [Thermoplasmata archaeon]